MPQTWASDNTDAICRLKIQYGTSILFPAITMGSHVSIVPNHQVGRITPLKTRFAVASSGNLGYELDLNKLNDEEKEEIKKQVAWYKQYRDVIQKGRNLNERTAPETAAVFRLSDADGGSCHRCICH